VMPKSPTVVRKSSVTLLLAIVLALCAASAGRAQPPQSGMPVPRLFSVFPCGCKAGSTVEVTFTGQDIEEPETLLFSDARLKAKPRAPPAPQCDPRESATKRSFREGVPKQSLGTREGVAPKKRTAKPAPPVTKFKITVPGEVPPGIHDVRLVNKWGVSNPR